MKTYKATTKSGERVSLYTDDTFTLALGNPNTISEETTASTLADCFSQRVLRGLLARTTDSGEQGKLRLALGEPEYGITKGDYETRRRLDKARRR